MDTKQISAKARWTRILSRLSLFAILTGALVTGCPGELEAPERFDPINLGLEAGQCDPYGVMTRTCGSKSCHGAEAPASELDLVSPGLDERVLNVAAKHEDVLDPTACPEGDLLVDPKNATESWLLKKIEKRQGGCGSPMPIAGKFPAEDKACLTDWILSLAGGGGEAGGSGK